MKEIFISELRNSVASGKAFVAFLLMLVAFLISLGMMSQEYQRRLDNYKTSLTFPAEDMFWNKIFYWEFEGGGLTQSDNITMPLAKIKPPDPMIFFARGLDTEMRQGVYFLETFPIIDLSVQPEQEVNLLNVIFPAPDFLFMVKVLVSLLAMLFAFDMICGERENGTLKLMLASGASRAGVFAGKFLGGILSLWVVFTAAFLVYLLALSFLTPVTLEGETIQRVGLIYLVSLLHVAVFFSLAAMISAFTRRSAPALVLTLFFWIVIVLVLPGLASLVAQQFARAESEQQVAQMKLKTAQAMEAEYSRQNPGSDRNYSGSYGVRHDEIRPQIVAEMQKIEDEHRRKKERQIALTSQLARVSPVGSLSHAMTSISRVGIDDIKLYREDLLKIRNTLEQTFTEYIRNPAFMMAYMQGKFDIPDVIKKEAYVFFNSIHSTGFRRPDLEHTFKSTWLDFLLMGVFAVTAAALTFARFIFYDPR